MPFDAPPATAEAVTSIDGEAPGTGVRRLPFVDGVRGLAAVVVMVGHLIYFVPSFVDPHRIADASALQLLAWPFRFNGEMVYLFLLVSGFSLYYSELARRSAGRAATTYREFAARRAWRIGPVYYLAFAFGLVVVLLLRSRLVLRAEDMTNLHLDQGGLISHVFLVHNLDADWLYQANAPLWSIAYEMQLYILFPLVFFAMRRWNPLVIAIVVVGAVKAISLTHPGFPIFGLAKWFVAGALLAELVHRGVRIPARIAVPAGLVFLGVGLAAFPALSSELRHDAIWLAAFLLLLFAGFEYPDSKRNPLAWRWMRWLGLRSYSLYALHFPVMLVVLYLAQRAHISGWTAVAFSVGIGAPVSLLITVISFRFVEGPSLKRVARVGRRPAVPPLGGFPTLADQPDG